MNHKMNTMESRIDLLNLLKKTQYIENYQPEHIKVISQLKNSLISIYFDWDEDEEWISFITNKNRVAMLNVHYPILFVQIDYRNFILVEKLYYHYNIICCDNFDDKIWFIDIIKFEKMFPKIIWHASREAVISDNFSTNDFWYATI